MNLLPSIDKSDIIYCYSLSHIHCPWPSSFVGYMEALSSWPCNLNDIHGLATVGEFLFVNRCTGWLSIMCKQR